MLVTLFPMVTLVKPLQPLNAELPMFFVIVTSLNDVGTTLELSEYLLAPKM